VTKTQLGCAKGQRSFLGRLLLPVEGDGFFEGYGKALVSPHLAQIPLVEQVCSSNAYGLTIDNRPKERVSAPEMEKVYSSAGPSAGNRSRRLRDRTVQSEGTGCAFAFGNQVIRRAFLLNPEGVYVFADETEDSSKTEITRGGEKILVTRKEFKH
jgi:hypothetical protein